MCCVAFGVFFTACFVNEGNCATPATLISAESSNYFACYETIECLCVFFPAVAKAKCVCE